MKKLTLSTLAIATALAAGTAQAGETSIGGYGELHYNNLSNGESGAAREEKREIDFHRFVLFFGHEYNDKVRFFSELELEHSLAGDDKPGEVELEQAYVEIDVAESTQFKAGLFLVPVGILNETHEPPTFYGVERNPVEKNIIPATWWEAGVALSGQFASGVSYDVALHSGLAGGTDIRGGRQKVAKANANDGAITARIKYTGIEGLELATSVQQQGDLTQDATDAINGGTLVETHAIYTIDALTLKALYAAWDIDVDGGDAADEQDGYYVEAGYKLTEKLGVFARYNEWSKDKTADDNEQTDIGVNYWPHENVVFKLDLVESEDKDGNEMDGFNLGVGYQF